MPICSYGVYPCHGQEKVLQQQIEKIPECELIPAQNHNMFILLTNTKDQEHEKSLQKKLHETESIQCLALSFAQCEEG